MWLFKLIVEIRYNNSKPNIFTFRERILSKITADKNAVPPKINDSIEVLVKNKLMKIVVASNRTAAEIVILKSIPNSRMYGQDNILKALTKIIPELNIATAERIGVRTQWINEVEMTTSELVNKFKDAFYDKKNKLIAKSEDITLNLTLSDSGNRINYIAAPFRKEELANFVKGNLSAVGHDTIEPTGETAIFVDYDYFTEKTTKFSLENLKSFMRNAIGKSESCVNSTIKSLEGENV